MAAAVARRLEEIDPAGRDGYQARCAACHLADLGGLKLAFAAYQASRAGQPPEAPVGGYSADQQFFLAAAQVWCTQIRPENARLRAATDPHSSARWRVNGPMSNLPEFAKAFQCKAGDPMVRAERCEVW